MINKKQLDREKELIEVKNSEIKFIKWLLFHNKNQRKINTLFHLAYFIVGMMLGVGLFR